MGHSGLHFSFSADNDGLSGRGTDYGYTGGFNITVTGGRLEEAVAPMHRMLSWVDGRVEFSRAHGGSEIAGLGSEALHGGMVAFTPRDIASNELFEQDRPYANLTYLGLSHYSLNEDQTQLYQSTLTLGLLGTSIAQEVQSALHSAVRLLRPRGYENQISDGGELTARYAVARHSLLAAHQGAARKFDAKLLLEGSVGYLTEAAVGLGFRWGRMGSPWWSGSSEYGEYAASPAPRWLPGESAGARRPLYFSAGAKLRARLYNAFLQGQFRDSVHTFSSDQLKPLVLDVWVAITTELFGLEVSYTLRHQTSELRNGLGTGDLTWAGITIGGNLR